MYAGVHGRLYDSAIFDVKNGARFTGAWGSSAYGYYGDPSKDWLSLPAGRQVYAGDDGQNISLRVVFKNVDLTGLNYLLAGHQGMGLLGVRGVGTGGYDLQPKAAALAIYDMSQTGTGWPPRPPLGDPSDGTRQYLFQTWIRNAGYIGDIGHGPDAGWNANPKGGPLRNDPSYDTFDVMLEFAPQADGTVHMYAFERIHNTWDIWTNGIMKWNPHDYNWNGVNRYYCVLPKANGGDFMNMVYVFASAGNGPYATTIGGHSITWGNIEVTGTLVPPYISSWYMNVDSYWWDSMKWSNGVPNGPTAWAKFNRNFVGDRVVQLADASGAPIQLMLNKLTFYDWSRGSDTLTLRAATQDSQVSVLTFAAQSAIDSQNAIPEYKASELDSTGLPYLAALRIDSKVVIADSGLTKIGSGSAAFFRQVSGSGNLNVNAGLLILAAANTYSGSTTVAGGTLQLRHSQAVAGTSGLTVTSGAVQLAKDLAGNDLTISGKLLALQGSTLGNLSGNNTWAGPVAFNSSNNVSVASGTTLTLRGNFSGAGSIIKLAPGTLVLDVGAGSTYSGAAINATEGDLQILGAGALAPAKFHNTGNSTGAGVRLTIGSADSSPQLRIQQFFHLGNGANAPMVVHQYSGLVSNAGTLNEPSLTDMSRLANVWGGATNGTGNSSPVQYNLYGGVLSLLGSPLYLSWKADATLNISGGTAYLKGLVLGYQSRDMQATVNLSRGDLYIGTGGIQADDASQPFTRKVLNLSGGTLGALDTWSYQNANMKLLAETTFDTDDYNVTLTGKFFVDPTTGKIFKTGAGTLYINDPNIQINPKTQLEIEEGQVIINGIAYGKPTPENPLIISPNPPYQNSPLVLTDWGFGDPQLENLPRSAKWLIVRGGTIQMTQNSSAPRAFTMEVDSAYPNDQPTLSVDAGKTWQITVQPRADGSDRYPLKSNLSPGQYLILTGEGTGQIDKVIPGSGGLKKTGTGTWILTAQNTYTGTTTIEQGVLEIRHPNALGASGESEWTKVYETPNSPATLQLATNTPGITFAPEVLYIRGEGVNQRGALYNASGNNTWTGPIILQHITSIGVAADSTLTISGVISTPYYWLYKVGPGTLVLTAQNTYTSGTRIEAGTLQLSGGNDRLNPASSIIITGGVLDLGGTTQNITGSAVVHFQGGVVQNGTINKAGGNYTTDGSSNNATVSAVLAGSAGLVKTGSGTLTLFGANTYTGMTTVSAGVLEIQNGDALGRDPGGQVTETRVADWAAIRLVGGSSAITVEKEKLYLGASSGDGSLRNISGNNKWQGDVAFTSTYGSTVNVAAESQLTISGTISGPGQYQALAKQGGGTLILTGANTYAGGTNVYAGKLLVNNTTDSGTGSGQVYVNSNSWTNRSILGGTGYIAGNVVLGNYGCITAADIGTTGTLTIGGDLTVGADILAIDILDAANYDQIVVNGTASLSSTNWIEILHGNWIPQGQANAITILKAANIQTNNLSFSISCGPLPGYEHQSHTGWNWAIVDLGGGWKGLNLWAAPEPASWLMLLLGGAGLGLLRWACRRFRLPVSHGKPEP